MALLEEHSPEQQVDTEAILGDLRIIDGDAHFTEPPDLWTSRVPAAYRGRVPVQKTRDGLTAWYLDDELWASIGGNVLRADHEKVHGEHIVQPFEAVDRAAWDARARVALMDDVGVYAQILYPNAIGFASNHVFAIEDLDLRRVVLQTYNDFCVEIQEESGGRLLPQALLPIWDMDLTIAEMTRLREQHITGFTLTDKPEIIGLPELPDPYFAPLWEFADQTRTVLNFHIGSGNRREAPKGHQLRRSSDTNEVYAQHYWKSFGPQRRLAIISTQVYMSNVRVIVNLCMGDLFDRYPNVRIVSAESGIGWVPFILETMDYMVDENITDPDEVALQQRRPSEYFRDHIYVTFWFERSAPMKLLDEVGVENVMVETDVPHPTCLYPGAREHFARVLAGVDPYVRRRVLQDNAAELYGITLPTP
jgi:predicted TIM-barrel fold metal-dependent hydrolase